MGSRSTLVVPAKLANCRPQEPVEGSGVPDDGAVERKHSDTSCSSSFCVNAISTDNESGLR
jgi:hypothetical protein